MAKKGKHKILLKGKKVWADGDTARASLHLDTYYGAIEHNGEIKYVVRKSLDEKFKDSDVKNIVDETVKEIVLNAIKEHGNLKKAIAEGIWMNKEKGIAIKKVRCFAPKVKNPINIRCHRDVSAKEYKQKYHVVNDGNYIMGVYIGTSKRGVTKRSFEFVSNFEAAEYFKSSTNKEILGYSIVPQKSKEGYPLAFKLKIGSIVLLYANSPEEIWEDLSSLNLVNRLYKIVALDKTNQRVVLRNVQEARPAKELETQFGVYKASDDYIPERVLRVSQLNMLVEGFDFKMSESGTILRLI